MNHLMDDAIPHPGALLARRTIDERVVRAKLHRAHTRRKDAVQHFIVADEVSALRPGIEMLLHGETLKRDGAFHSMHQDIGITKAV